MKVTKPKTIDELGSYAEIAKGIPSPAIARNQYLETKPQVAPTMSYAQQMGLGGGFLGNIANNVNKAVANSKPVNKPLSYQDFFAQQNALDQEIRDAKLNYYNNLQKDAYASAEAQRVQADKNAQITNERQTVDARNSYAENVATRGANAEQLAQMGLSGSGYADFIDANAYATQRSEIANANAQEENAKRNASYQEFLLKNAADRESSEGKLSAELGYKQALMNNNANKFAYEQALKDKEEVKGQQSEVKENVGTSNYLKALQESGAPQEKIIDEMVKSGQFTAEQGQDILFQDLSNGLNEGANIVDRAETAYKNGKISKDHYEALKGTYNESLNVSSSAFANEQGEVLSKEDAKKLYEQIKNDKWISQESKDKFDSIYNEMYASNFYKGYKMQGSFNNTKVFEGKGTNFNILNGDKVIHVQSSGPVDDPKIKELAKNYPSGAVFTSGDKIYAKVGDIIIGVEKRGMSYHKEFDEFYKEIFE